MKTKFPDPKLGEVFGKLTCIGVRTHKAGNGNWLYQFKCDCGGGSYASKYDIFKKGYKSCGCTRKDGMRSPPGDVSFTSLYVSCRRAAELRDLEFSLTREYHKSLVVKDCYHCGKPPRAYNHYVNQDGSRRCITKMARQSTIDLSWIYAHGVDRLDNSKGYTIENAVSCCAACNRGKWESTDQEYYEHCRAVVAFQEELKVKKAS